MRSFSLVSAMFGKPRRPSMVVDWKMSSASINTSSMASRPANKSKTGNCLRRKVPIGSVRRFSRPPGFPPMSRARSLLLSARVPKLKVLEYCFPRLDRLLADDVRLILLDFVPAEHITALEIAERKHRKRFVHISPADESLQRKALAGADIFLVPGPTEPEAIWLRRAMLFGAIPLAAQCPGLFQFVRDWEQSRGEGNGFVFSAQTPTDCWTAAAKPSESWMIRQRAICCGSVA